jgi:hypothetical protein
MIKLFKPLGNGAYKRIIVQDAAEYLDNGWYLSPEDHQKPVATQEKEEKPKRKPRAKKAKTEG